MGTACNSLQPPHRTAEGGKRTTAQGIGARPFGAGGSGSGGRRSGVRPAGPGAAPAATSHRPAAPAGNLPPAASYCDLARPAANPPPALTAAQNTAQFLHKSEGEGEREAAAEGKGERGNFRGCEPRVSGGRRCTEHTEAGRGQGRRGKGWRDRGMKGGRLPAPRGTNSPPSSSKPASPFIRLPPGSYVRKERPSRTQPERRCTGIKVQIMATTTPFREWQLPPAHPHHGAGMRLLLPPLLAAHPLRQRWIWRGPSRGEVRRRAEPLPLHGRERPSLFTCPGRVLPARPGGPRRRPSGVNPLPAFPRFTRAASRVCPHMN